MTSTSKKPKPMNGTRVGSLCWAHGYLCADRHSSLLATSPWSKMAAFYFIQLGSERGDEEMLWEAATEPRFISLWRWCNMAGTDRSEMNFPFPVTVNLNCMVTTQDENG